MACHRWKTYLSAMKNMAPATLPSVFQKNLLCTPTKTSRCAKDPFHPKQHLIPASLQSKLCAVLRCSIIMFLHQLNACLAHPSFTKSQWMRGKLKMLLQLKTRSGHQPLHLTQPRTPLWTYLTPALSLNHLSLVQIHRKTPVMTQLNLSPTPPLSPLHPV